MKNCFYLILMFFIFKIHPAFSQLPSFKKTKSEALYGRNFIDSMNLSSPFSDSICLQIRIWETNFSNDFNKLFIVTQKQNGVWVACKFEFYTNDFISFDSVRLAPIILSDQWPIKFDTLCKLGLLTIKPFNQKKEIKKCNELVVVSDGEDFTIEVIYAKKLRYAQMNNPDVFANVCSNSIKIQRLIKVLSLLQLELGNQL